MSENLSVELLEHAVSLLSSAEVAVRLEVSRSTVSRWLNGKAAPKPYVADRLHNLIASHISERSVDYRFRFIDLFAGIGGIRIGFERAGGRCVFTSEWDTYAQKTYNANFHFTHEITGDITKVNADDIPDHEVLLAGFPCQPFSIAGVSKKNSLNMPHGFADKTQGTLFFDVARIIETKKPEVVILENVKNLRSHDRGNTYKTIISVLQNDLGYTVYDRVFDGQHWVPQHRERIVIVAFKNPVLFGLENVSLPQKGSTTMRSVLHRTDGLEPILDHDGDRYFDFQKNRVHDKYTLSDKLWKYLQDYAAKHRRLGNGFGYGLVNEDSISRTLSARYYKDGSEILIDQGPKKNPRRLTPREAARIMGFPDTFVIPVSDTRAYKQFGNSVVVPLFAHIASYIVDVAIESRLRTN